MFKTLAWSTCIVSLAAMAAVHAAETYPARPLRLIVPFSAGGAADIVARLLGNGLSKGMNTQVVIDTRPGGGTVLGTDLAVHANPDGYTLVLVATAHATNPGLLGKLPYDPLNDFAPITLAVDTPLIFVVPASLAVMNLRVKHLIVMGHSGCGGVKACLDQSAAIQTEAMFISRWMSMLDDARLRVLASHQMQPAAEKLKALEMEGVKTSIANLRTFPFVKDLEDKGRLSLHGAYFEIATGTLSVLNHSRNEFFAL